MHYILPFMRLAALAMALTYTTNAVRAGNPNPTDYDWAMVPIWCPYAGTAANTFNTLDRIKDPLIRGKIFSLDKSGCNGYHHYCYALIWGNRGFLYDGDRPAIREGYYNSAVDDYQYVLSQSQPSCSLLPEIYTKIGELKAQLGNPKEAEASYLKALKTKPGYAPALIGLSDLSESQGATTKAIALLREGLKTNPQSSALKKKLQRLETRAGSQENRP